MKVRATILTGERRLEHPRYYVRDIGSVPEETLTHMAFAGILFREDPALPDGVLEARLPDGEPLSRLSFG